MKLALCTGTLERDGTQGERQYNDLKIFSELSKNGKLDGIQLYVTPGTSEEDLRIYRDFQQEHDIDFIVHAAHIGSKCNFPDPNFDALNRNCIKEAKFVQDKLSAVYSLFHAGGSPKCDIHGSHYQLFKTDPVIGRKAFKDMARILVDTIDASQIIFENEPYNDFTRDIVFWRANDLEEFDFLSKTGICYDGIHCYVSAVQKLGENLEEKGQLKEGFSKLVYDSYSKSKPNLTDFLKSDSDLESVNRRAIVNFVEYHGEFMQKNPVVYQIGGTKNLSLVDDDGEIDGEIGSFMRGITLRKIGVDDFLVYEGSVPDGKKIIEEFH